MKKRILGTVLCAITLSLSVGLLNPNFAHGQSTDPAPPIGFNYAGDMKPKNEDGKNYIYIYCNQYEGTTCSRPDGAMRIEIPKVSGWLKAIFPGG